VDWVVKPGNDLSTREKRHQNARAIRLVSLVDKQKAVPAVFQIDNGAAFRLDSVE
jgi:hypothetical protein